MQQLIPLQHLSSSLGIFRIEMTMKLWMIMSVTVNVQLCDKCQGRKNLQFLQLYDNCESFNMKYLFCRIQIILCTMQLQLDCVEYDAANAKASTHYISRLHNCETFFPQNFSHLKLEYGSCTDHHDSLVLCISYTGLDSLQVPSG